MLGDGKGHSEDATLTLLLLLIPCHSLLMRHQLSIAESHVSQTLETVPMASTTRPAKDAAAAAEGNAGTDPAPASAFSAAGRLVAAGLTQPLRRCSSSPRRLPDVAVTALRSAAAAV